jgi:hypothetical protein
MCFFFIFLGGFGGGALGSLCVCFVLFSMWSGVFQES